MEAESQEIEVQKVQEKRKFVEHGQLAISGGLHYPNYGSNDSDTIRGEQALRAMKKVLESGYEVVATVTEKTNELFREKLNLLKRI